MQSKAKMPEVKPSSLSDTEFRTLAEATYEIEQLTFPPKLEP